MLQPRAGYGDKITTLRGAGRRGGALGKLGIGAVALGPLAEQIRLTITRVPDLISEYWLARRYSRERA